MQIAQAMRFIDKMVSVDVGSKIAPAKLLEVLPALRYGARVEIEGRIEMHRIESLCNYTTEAT